MPERPTSDVCPFCREAVNAEATRCGHCGSDVMETPSPSHGGVCPFCREAIHPEALRCKHCRSFLAPGLAEGDDLVVEGEDVGGESAERPVPQPGRYGRFVCRRKRVCTPEWGWVIVGPNGQKKLGWTVVCRDMLVCTTTQA